MISEYISNKGCMIHLNTEVVFALGRAIEIFQQRHEFVLIEVLTLDDLYW
jgi:hypothetical protein